MKLLAGVIVGSLLLAGCDFEDSDDDDAQQTFDEEGVGFFIDSPVQGLSYSSASHSGTTDELGRFDYEEGESMTFSFGDISLPAVSASKAIHVSDLYANGLSDTQTINLARLLLTIDSDGDYDNGIQLSSTAVDPSETPNSLDFDSSSFDTNVNAYITAVANAAGSSSLSTLVSVQEATDHITDTRAEVDGLLTGCGNECVRRAAYNEYVVSVSPRHAQTVDADITTLEIEFTQELSFDINDIELEMFELAASTENCRIDWPGLRCGDLGIDSYDLAIGATRSTSADVNLEFIDKSVVGNKITFTLSGDSLLANDSKLYIAHIFNDQEEGFDDDYKTWWLFYAE